MYRIADEDLIAKEAVYHSSCLATYLSTSDLKIKAQTTVTQEKSVRDSAFDQLINNTDQDLMINNKAFLLANLLERYKAFLPPETNKTKYNTSNLGVKHYETSISFSTWRGQGKSTFVLLVPFCSSISLADS